MTRRKGTIIPMEKKANVQPGLYNAVWENDNMMLSGGPDAPNIYYCKTREIIAERRILVVRIEDGVVETFGVYNIEFAKEKVHLVDGIRHLLPLTSIRHWCGLEDRHLVFNTVALFRGNLKESSEFMAGRCRIMDKSHHIVSGTDVKEMYLWGPMPGDGVPSILEITVNSGQTFFHHIVYTER